MFIKDDYVQLDKTEYDALQDVLQSQRRNDKIGLEFVFKPQKAVRVQPYHWSVAEYYHWLKDKDSESYPHYFGIAYGVYPRVVKLTKYDPAYLEKLALETEGSYWQIHANNSLSLLFNTAEDAKRVADYLRDYNMSKYVEVGKKELESIHTTKQGYITMQVVDGVVQISNDNFSCYYDAIRDQESRKHVLCEQGKSSVFVTPRSWNVQEFFYWLEAKEELFNFFDVATSTDSAEYTRVVKLMNAKYRDEYINVLKEASIQDCWYVTKDNVCSLIFLDERTARIARQMLVEYNQKRYVEKLDVTNTLDDMLGHTKQRLAQTKPTPYASTYAVGKISLADLVANEVIHTNENGGKQSYTPAAFDLLPAEAIATIAVVLGHGANKYGANNWRKIPVHDHINHALQHLFAYLSCPNEEDLSHAATRLLFALELYKVAAKHPQETTLQPSSKDATT